MTEKRYPDYVDPHSRTKIVDDAVRDKAQELLLKGWSIPEVATYLEVNRSVVTDWIQMFRDEGAAIPVNLDARAVRARRHNLSEWMDRLVDFCVQEADGLMSTVQQARTSVDEDLRLRREPIEIGSGATEKTMSTKGTLLSPNEAMRVYATGLDKVRELAADISSALEASEQMLVELNEEGHELEAETGHPLALPPGVPDLSERRNLLRRQVS